MVCPNCSSETNGLKLNNRLYCTECGFLLDQPEVKIFAEKEPAPIEVPEVKEVEPEVIKKYDVNEGLEARAKMIAEDPEKYALDPLEAEEEVLDLVIEEAESLSSQNKKEPKKEDKPNLHSVEENGSLLVTTKVKLPKTNNQIQKKNRPRTDLKKEGDFVLVEGEPDPIAEPEITEAEETTAPVTTEVPILEPSIEENPPAEKTEHVLDVSVEPDVEEVEEDEEENEVAEPKEQAKEDSNEEESKKVAKTKKNPNSDMLLNYFKQVGNGSSQKSGKGKKKKKKGFRWGLFAAIAIPVVIAIGLVGLVLYVNLYAARPNVALKTAEQKASFSHLKPNYLPAGYSLTYNTGGDVNSITYVYEYQPDKSKTLSIKAEKTNLTTGDIRAKIIDPSGQKFVNVESGGKNIWAVGDDRLYFIDSGVLYTISANSDLGYAELLKIAESLN